MLSRFGKVLMVKNNDSLKARFDWGDALCDSAIMGGVAFANALLGGLADGSLTPWDLTVACVGAFASFIGFLALKRNLVKQAAPAA